MEKLFPPQIAGKPASISRLVKTLKAEDGDGMSHGARPGPQEPPRWAVAGTVAPRVEPEGGALARA